MTHEPSEAAWLASFPEQNPNPILEFDPATGVVFYANPAVLRLAPAIKKLGPRHPLLAGLETVEATLKRGEVEVVVREVALDELYFVQTISHIPEFGRLRVYSTDITERKRAETAASRLAAIVEFSDDAIIGKDLDGIITSWNKGAEKIFGYTASEMVGSSILRLIPDDRSKEEDHILGKIKRGEKVTHFETLRQTKDGRLINISVTASPIKDASGRIIGASKVARDITERCRAEEARRTSEARLSFALQTSQTGAWELSLEDGTAHRTLIHDQIFGYDALLPVWTYEMFLDHVLPDDRSAVDKAFREAVAAGQNWSFECRVRRADGQIRWIWAAGGHERDSTGKAVRLSGIVQDISERKRSEQALRDSEDRFRTMANSIPQLAWVARADGFIFWYNQRWYDYTGTTPEQMEGWGWQTVHDPVTLPSVLERWKRAINTGKMFEMEFPLLGVDGKFRSFLTRVQPFKDSEGRVTQWFGTNTDVELLKQAEQEIQRLNSGLECRVAERTAQLEAANKELEAFSYSVSHDLRAPLRAINGFAEIVLEDSGPQLDAEARGHLARIRNGGRQMGQLIDDLLSFSRTGRQEMNWQKVIMDGLVKTALLECRPQQADRQIELKVARLPDCWGDRSLLKQVWLNLISNAIKYSRGRTPAVIEIGFEVDNDENVYFVRDNGTGFDMRFVGKLFGVFQRLHRQDDFEGTGVGLAIVQRIIHRHGGRIWAEAEEGRGATFYFTLAQRSQS